MNDSSPMSARAALEKAANVVTLDLDGLEAYAVNAYENGTVCILGAEMLFVLTRKARGV